MQCSKCNRNAILFQPYSGQHLCREHAILDIEAKAKRTIRHQRGIETGDHIAVILDGDPAGNALLFFLQKLTADRRDIRVSSFPLLHDDDVPSFVQNTGTTVIARATTLEAASARILTGILRGNPGICISGDEPAGGALRIMTPFSHIPAEEIALYGRINGLEDSVVPDPGENGLDADVKTLLADYTSRHPAAPHAILNLCDMLCTGGQGRSKNKTGTGTEQLMSRTRKH